MEKKDIAERTETFRTSFDPLWIRLRHLLIEKNFDPLSMALAYFQPEDIKLRFGILVNENRRVYKFSFDFAYTKSKDGIFSEWEDITENYSETPFHKEIDAALALLTGENG